MNYFRSKFFGFGLVCSFSPNNELSLARGSFLFKMQHSLGCSVLTEEGLALAVTLSL